MRKRIGKKLLLIVLGLMFAYLAAAYVYIPLRATVPFYGKAELYIEMARYAPFSDGGVCPFWERVQGMRRHIDIRRRTKEIIGQSTSLKREANGLELWRTPKGDIWVPQTNDLWSAAVVLSEQEHNMYGNPGELGVHQGDVVLDGGAHIGLFTRTALASGARLVVAIEPTPESAECIRRNEAEAIKNGRLIVVEEGVSDKQESVVFQRNSECSVCNRQSEGQEPPSKDFTAKLTTIDELVSRLKLDRVDFIKLDIENAELKAIQGGRRTIAANRPRMAVAAENAKDRSAYAHQIISELRGLKSDYQYHCGACSVSNWHNISVEILDFY